MIVVFLSLSAIQQPEMMKILTFKTVGLTVFIDGSQRITLIFVFTIFHNFGKVTEILSGYGRRMKHSTLTTISNSFEPFALSSGGSIKTRSHTCSLSCSCPLVLQRAT